MNSQKGAWRRARWEAENREFLRIRYRIAGACGVEAVSEYNATTGAVINASFITGLGSSAGVGIGLAWFGNTLFVANFFNGTVGAYDATTGAAINASFITGLTTPSGLAVKKRHHHQ